jgi:hypothetical protein
VPICATGVGPRLRIGSDRNLNDIRFAKDYEPNFYSTSVI